MLRLALFFAIGLLLGSCGSEVSRLSARLLAEPYEIDFAEQPRELPRNFIALTFDDVPDWNHTSQVLDVLKSRDVKATFFINTYNWSDVATEIPMQELIRRMAIEGHTIANHTARHQRLPLLTSDQIESEISTVENLVTKILGPNAAPLTLLRAPFGEPYQFKDPNSIGYRKVSAVVARHAVHIGWSMDALDYACPQGDADCVHDNVMSKVDDGAYGIVVLHGTYESTALALPTLIDALRRLGFVFGSVEDAVKARYGASSRQLLQR